MTALLTQLGAIAVASVVCLVVGATRSSPILLGLGTTYVLLAIFGCFMAWRLRR